MEIEREARRILWKAHQGRIDVARLVFIEETWILHLTARDLRRAAVDDGRASEGRARAPVAPPRRETALMHDAGPQRHRPVDSGVLLRPR